MARTKKEPPIYADVEHVIALITDQQLLSWDQLHDVAVKWCSRDYAFVHELAERVGARYIALVLAALLHVSHPLLVSPGRGLMYAFMRCHAEILRVQIFEIPVVVPMPRNSIHRPNENNLVPVESVDNSTPKRAQGAAVAR